MELQDLADQRDPRVAKANRVIPGPQEKMDVLVSRGPKVESVPQELAVHLVQSHQRVKWEILDFQVNQGHQELRVKEVPKDLRVKLDLLV